MIYACSYTFWFVASEKLLIVTTILIYDVLVTTCPCAKVDCPASTCEDSVGKLIAPYN